MMNIEQLIEMGGYGNYVWPAYGIGLAVLLLNIIVPLYKKQQMLKSIIEAQHRDKKNDT